MDFLNILIDLLFLSGTIPIEYKYSDPVFSLGSGFMGMLVISLDWIAYMTLGKSFFSLTHGGLKSVRLIILWVVGGVITGYFGTVAAIFQLNRFGCLAAGITGPLILPQLRRLFSQSEEIQEATEENEEDE
ncbi:MAG: hypothetical protein D8M58_17925 [Calditrichaeota bacterium]|nr:MAG: hypothetical protein DWQ03_01840 [Calditrichota bacterium]MBL1207287.1 hypothetical protein [Calditrichota bacterium]NOG47119.1 hypothetical protein [Calditrichota bacterium]